MKPFASEASHRLFRHGLRAPRGRPRCARLYEALLIALLCSSACEHSDASLMRVTRVSQDEESHVLFVHGEGFFAGAKCKAKLSGQLFRPFGARTGATRTWPCRARSEREIAVRLNGEDEGGLLEGELEVSFIAKDASQTFLAVAESPVRVRLSEASLPARLAQNRAARTFAHELGLHVETHARGLLVTHLIAGSRAAQAGVQLRDVIRRIDGSPVEKPIDLVPSSLGSSPVLELARGQSVVFVAVAVQGGARKLAPGPASGLAFALAFITLSLLPVATRRAYATKPGEPPRYPWKALDLKMLALGATLTLASAVVVSLSGTDLRWAFVTPWLTFAALELPDAWRARHRLSACLRTLVPLLGCAIGLACISILGGERGAVSSANSAPSTWLLFCSPAAWVAWLAIQRGVPRPDDASSFSRRLTAAWLACTTAWLVAALGLGGGAWGGSEPPAAFTSHAVSVIKTGALVLWLLRSSYRPDSEGLWLLLSAPVATAAWLVLSPSDATSALIAYACMGALLALVVKHLIDRKDRSGLLPPDPLLEPFR